MRFFKKTNTEKKTSSPTPTPAAQKSPYEDAVDWSVAQNFLYIKSEKNAWFYTMILGGICLLLATTIVLMMPLKKTVPYVIEVDKSTGMSQILEIANTKNIPVSELMDKYWLNQYVKSRETYDYYTDANEYLKTRALSTPSVFEPYAKTFDSKNPQNIEKTLGTDKVITVDVLSVVPNGNNVGTVRFIKTLKDRETGKVENKTGWIASIGYEYYPTLKATEPNRLINPFGFKVTSYRVDPEALTGETP